MIALPPNVTINHEVTVMVDDLTVDMLKWYIDQGQSISRKIWYDGRGREKEIAIVQYGRGRPSYKTQDGSNQHLLRFHQEDAGAALMFLMTFTEQITQHNMREADKYVY